MRLLHAYDLHRGGGGADNATRATISVLRESGIEVDTFERDSAGLIQNCRGSRAESLAFGLRNAVARRFSQRTSTSTSHRHGSLPTGCLSMARWEARVTAIPCVIDMPRDMVDPGGGGYVAFAGRFVPEKGVGVAIAAARKAGLPLGRVARACRADRELPTPRRTRDYRP